MDTTQTKNLIMIIVRDRRTASLFLEPNVPEHPLVSVNVKTINNVLQMRKRLTETVTMYSVIKFGAPSRRYTIHTLKF